MITKIKYATILLIATFSFLFLGCAVLFDAPIRTVEFSINDIAGNWWATTSSTEVSTSPSGHTTTRKIPGIDIALSINNFNWTTRVTESGRTWTDGGVFIPSDCGMSADLYSNNAGAMVGVGVLTSARTIEIRLNERSAIPGFYRFRRRR